MISQKCDPYISKHAFNLKIDYGTISLTKCNWMGSDLLAAMSVIVFRRNSFSILKPLPAGRFLVLSTETER